MGKSDKKPTVEELYAPVLFPAQEDKCSRGRSNSKTRILFFFSEVKLTIMSSQLNSAKRILFLKLNIDGCSKNILSG